MELNVVEDNEFVSYFDSMFSITQFLPRSSLTSLEKELKEEHYAKGVLNCLSRDGPWG